MPPESLRSPGAMEKARTITFKFASSKAHRDDKSPHSARICPFVDYYAPSEELTTFSSFGLIVFRALSGFLSVA